jgi:hypothetical protein
MKTKTNTELVKMCDAVKYLERAASELTEASEKLLAGRVRCLRSELETEISKWEVVASNRYGHGNLP